MKVLVAVALFAFVAVQQTQGLNELDTGYNNEALAEVLSGGKLGAAEMSHGAPAPEEEKKEDPAAVSSPAAAPAEATSEAAAAAAEVKSEAPSSDAPAAPAAVAAAAAPAAPAAETPAPAEEKKA